MKAEIQCASTFLLELVMGRKRPSAADRLRRFGRRLEQLMATHFADHWFPQSPCRGSGYRCIRFDHRLDPLVERAAADAGLEDDERAGFPKDLALWVDPCEVSYRIGEKGSICVLYQAPHDPPCVLHDPTWACPPEHVRPDNLTIALRALTLW